MTGRTRATGWYRLVGAAIPLVLLLVWTALVSTDVIVLTDTRKRLAGVVAAALTSLLINLVTLPLPRWSKAERAQSRVSSTLRWDVSSPVPGVDGIFQRPLARFTLPGLHVVKIPTEHLRAFGDSVVRAAAKTGIVAAPTIPAGLLPSAPHGIDPTPSATRVVACADSADVGDATERARKLLAVRRTDSVVLLSATDGRAFRVGDLVDAWQARHDELMGGRLLQSLKDKGHGAVLPDIPSRLYGYRVAALTGLHSAVPLVALATILGIALALTNLDQPDDQDLPPAAVLGFAALALAVVSTSVVHLWFALADRRRWTLVTRCLILVDCIVVTGSLAQNLDVSRASQLALGISLAGACWAVNLGKSADGDPWRWFSGGATALVTACWLVATPNGHRASWLAWAGLAILARPLVARFTGPHSRLTSAVSLVVISGVAVAAGAAAFRPDTLGGGFTTRDQLLSYIGSGMLNWAALVPLLFVAVSWPDQQSRDAGQQDRLGTALLLAAAAAMGVGGLVVRATTSVTSNSDWTYSYERSCLVAISALAFVLVGRTFAGSARAAGFAFLLSVLIPVEGGVRLLALVLLALALFISRRGGQSLGSVFLKQVAAPSALASLACTAFLVLFAILVDTEPSMGSGWFITLALGEAAAYFLALSLARWRAWTSQHRGSLALILVVAAAEWSQAHGSLEQLAAVVSALLVLLLLLSLRWRYQDHVSGPASFLVVAAAIEGYTSTWVAVATILILVGGPREVLFRVFAKPKRRDVLFGCLIALFVWGHAALSPVGTRDIVLPTIAGCLAAISQPATTLSQVPLSRRYESFLRARRFIRVGVGLLFLLFSLALIAVPELPSGDLAVSLAGGVPAETVLLTTLILSLTATTVGLVDVLLGTAWLQLELVHSGKLHLRRQSETLVGAMWDLDRSGLLRLKDDLSVAVAEPVRATTGSGVVPCAIAPAPRIPS